MKPNQFSLNRLHSMALQAQKYGASIIAFPYTNGRGCFTCITCFNRDDNGKYLGAELYLVLRRTQDLRRLKFFGNQLRDGKFDIYLTKDIEDAIIKELDIQKGSGQKFTFQKFFHDLNAAIPQNFSPTEVSQTLKAVRPYLARSEFADDIEFADKIYLIGPRKLPEGHKPKEKTIRKLFYAAHNGSPDDIQSLLYQLKRTSHTLAWTDNPKYSQADLSKLAFKLQGLS